MQSNIPNNLLQLTSFVWRDGRKPNNSNIIMIHIGQCIRQQIEAQGKTTVWLASQLGCHRTNVYKIYEKLTIDTGVLLRISEILCYDFFMLYSEEFMKEEEEEK